MVGRGRLHREHRFLTRTVTLIKVLGSGVDPLVMTVAVGILEVDQRTADADVTGRAGALREAADPNTSPWRLAAIANHLDPDVRMAVAANPSASGLTILRLRSDVDPRVRVVLTGCRETDR